MEQEAKNISESMTQFWGSVVQDEQLDQLTTQAQEAKGQLMTLKMALRSLSLMVHIAHSEELKYLHQRAAHA